MKTMKYVVYGVLLGLGIFYYHDHYGFNFPHAAVDVKMPTAVK